MRGLLTPDEVLLRRFGFVRAVGGAAYFLAVAVLLVIYGSQAWPLLVGVPVLAIVTTWYFRRSARHPRALTMVSLLADVVVLAAAGATVGGTGSGIPMLQVIVIVSAGILLGPLASRVFTGLAVLAALVHLAIEEAGVTPVVLHRPELGDRLTLVAISIGVLLSVGFLTEIYASRLHELIAEAGARAAHVRRRGRRRRSLVRRASVDVREPLADLEAVAEILEDPHHAERGASGEVLASRLRMDVARLHAEVGRLEDLGVLGADLESRPEPVSLRRVVDDCLVALADELQDYDVEVEVSGDLKVVAHRRALRRVVLTLLENVVEHTPAGTSARIDGVSAGGHAALVITDNGPGISEAAAERLFEPTDEAGARVGLPLLSELCQQMDAACRYEPAPGGGARFLISLRLAPSAAPSDDEPVNS